MASKRRSFISLIFIINCITKCSLIRILSFGRLKCGNFGFKIERNEQVQNRTW